MSISAANTAFSDALVGALLTAEVEHAVISPGSRNTPIVLALHRAAESKALRTHVVVDERAAGFVALGMARATGKPVVLSCTSGSAGAHYLPAISEAARSGVPLVAITADRPQSLHERGAPQTMPQRGLFGEHVCQTIAADAPRPGDDLRWLSGRIAAGVHAMRRSGLPLHVNAAFHEPLWDAEEDAAMQRRPGRSDTDTPKVRILPAAATLSEAQCRALAGLKTHARVLVIAGPESDVSAATASARRSRAVELLELCSARGWALVSDPVSCIGRFGGSVGHHADIIARDEAAFATLAPDRVLLFGDWPTSKSLSRALAALPAGTITSVRPHGDLQDPWFCVGTVIEAPVSAVVDFLKEDGSEQLDESYLTQWVEADRVVEAVLEERAREDDKLWEWSIARAIARDIREGWLHLASSMPIRDFDAFAGPLRNPIPTYANRGVNGIDGLIATAAGVSIASGETVTLVIGDIAAQHDWGGMAAARALEGAKIRLVVIDNDGGQIFRHLPISQNQAAFDRYFVTHQPIDLVSAAMGAGWTASRARGIDDISHALRREPSEDLELIYAAVEGAEQKAKRDELVDEALKALRLTLGAQRETTERSS